MANPLKAAIAPDFSGQRLPIYILLDCSGSMAGDPIHSVCNQLTGYIKDLPKELDDKSRVHLCLITFGGTVKVAVPLMPIQEFEIPDLAFGLGGSTPMGEALDLLVQTRKKWHSNQDAAPIVLLLTDGVPTDDYPTGLKRFKSLSWGRRIAFAINNANESSLLSFLDSSLAPKGYPDESQNLIRIKT